MEQHVFVVDKKAIICDMMIDIAQIEFQIDIRKNYLPKKPTILDKKNNKNNKMFTCYLFGVYRQVFHRRIKRKSKEQAKLLKRYLWLWISKK